MHNELPYAAEKFSQAVDRLATGSEPLDERLLKALEAIGPLGMESTGTVTAPVPADLAEDIHDFLDRMSSTKAEGGEGSYTATIRGLPPPQLSEAAREILDIEYRLNQANLGS